MNQCKWDLLPIYIGDKMAVWLECGCFCNDQCRIHYLNNGKHSKFYQPIRRKP